MKLFIRIIVLFAISLYANNPDKIEIYTTDFRSQGDILKLNGGVSIIYGEYVLYAKKAIYNKKTNILELFENIKISNQKEYKIIGNYAKLDLSSKKREFKPFFMLEKKSQVWLSANCGYSNKEIIDIDDGVVSGCNPIDPLWQIEFSSSDYNQNSKWLNLYNAIIYIYDIPIFYTPYFGYSLDTTRRTGLLTPSFGISNDEGLFYQQPIYIAEYNWWDLEIDPQIRTLRGKGIYSTFRFVDSKFSKGSITSGIFKEDSSYFNANDLINEKHYGFNLNYQNTNLLQSWLNIDKTEQTSLYIDINYMNDVDYINLSKNDTTKTATPNQVLSRVNMFYNSEDNYLGLYSNYYIDLSKEDNSQTLQKLPTIQYHRYIKTLLKNHLLYNLNLESRNLYRKTGVKAIQTDLSIPLTLQTKLFDEYLIASYSTTLYSQHTKFTDNNTTFLENGYYVRNSNIFELQTQLTKPYKNFTHTIGFSTTYITKGFNKTSGYYKINKDICFENPSAPECEFYNISDIKEAVYINFNQFFFDKQNSQKVYHRLSQVIVDFNQQTQQVGELENELDYKVTKTLSFYNNTFYNYKQKNISKTLNKISYTDFGINLSLSHFYKTTFDTQPNTSYITSSINYKYNSHYRYMAKFDYDLINKTKKQAQIGFNYDKRCWSFGLRYAENNRPVLTNNLQNSSIYERYIYFTILLKPIMKPSKSNEFGIRLPNTLTN